MDRDIEIPGDPRVTVALRRYARARRLSLRVSRLDGRAVITAPPRTPFRDVEAFVHQKADWVRSQLARTIKPIEVEPDVKLPVEGKELLVVKVVEAERPELFPDHIKVPGDHAGAAVKELLKTLAGEKLKAAANRHAKALGCGYTRITLRDPRSRWGSCSRARCDSCSGARCDSCPREGNLMFSWRLILAPPEVLDYVAAHEVAHLEEMNHGPRFKELCQHLCPGWREHHEWLRENWPKLHRWRF